MKEEHNTASISSSEFQLYTLPIAQTHYPITHIPIEDITLTIPN